MPSNHMITTKVRPDNDFDLTSLPRGTGVGVTQSLRPATQLEPVLKRALKPLGDSEVRRNGFRSVTA
jgi:hypothetical protein